MFETRGPVPAGVEIGGIGKEGGQEVGSGRCREGQRAGFDAVTPLTGVRYINFTVAMLKPLLICCQGL